MRQSSTVSSPKLNINTENELVYDHNGFFVVHSDGIVLQLELQSSLSR